LDDFIVPPIEAERPLPSSKEASEQAFYAASASTGNPVADYTSAKMDLETTGESEFVNNVKSQWNQEQDAGNRQAIEGIIGDNTVSSEVKKAVLRHYSQSGYVPGNLKDRYIQKTAANDILNDTVADQNRQDWVVDNMKNRRAQMDYEQRQYDIANNTDKLKSFLGGISHLYQGAGNTLGLVSDEEYKKGHEEFKKLSEANPLTTGIGHAVGLIGGGIAGAVAGIPGMVLAGGSLAGMSKFAELGTNPNVTDEDRLNASLADAGMTGADFALPIFKAAGILKTIALNGGGAVALGELNTTIQNKILEAYPELQQKQFDPKSMTVNAVLGGLIGAVFGRGARVNNTPSIPPGSPADVTKAANPKMAETLGAMALKDKSGIISEGLGAEKGSIVNDWVLPKLDENIAKDNPDLAAKIHELDNQMEREFNDFRYDPNIVDATKRDQDAANIFQVIKENRGSYYQQSNSMVSLPSTGMSEGTMVFGPNATGKFLTFDEATEAAKNLAYSIKQLPESERGNLNIVGTGTDKKGKPVGPFHLEWKWNRVYDDISIRTFGPDSIQTSVLGMDVSSLARSALGRWLFPTGRLPNEVEQAAIRGIERNARLEDTFVTAFTKNIAHTKHGKELNTLINDAEELGIESFSKADMSAKFPDLSSREIDNLFETHTYWRRMQHYNHNFANRIQRNKLLNDDMKGVYDEAGNYLGAASPKLPAGTKDIQTIWDYDLNKAIPFKPDEIANSGRKIVRLAEHIEEAGKVHEFGIVGGKTTLSLLPNEVLPRVPGYSPRMVKEPFFVDIRPNTLEVNGVRITDQEKLRNYSKTVGAAKNEYEARQIAKQAQADNPNHVVTVRPERQDTFGKVVTDYQVHNQMFKQSQKRGERLPSLHGPARIEDRLASLVKTAQSLSRIEAFSAWENSFRDAFTKGFGKFLSQGEFPQFKTDIKPLENMGRAEKQEFDTAHRMFEFYSKMKTYETLGDHLWKKSLHNIADILEKWKIPAGLLRDLGSQGNLAVKYPKMISSVAYIHMSPIRQWLIQPAQLMEMYAINPHTAANSFKDMMAVRMALSSNATLLKPFAKIMKGYTSRMSSMPPEEFHEVVEAIEKSGMLQSIDMNVLVHGIFKEVDRNLVENIPEKALKDLQNTIKALPRATRTVGFDAAELTNRVGMYLQAKALWHQQNPGKDWRTKEAKEAIAAEGMRLSGTMNKAGNLPYQEGALSVLFQFAAISQKLLMNLIQDNATIMSPAQRARLAAVRLSLYGAKYGLPAGAAAYYFIERSDDPDLKANAEVVKRGLVDYAANRLIASQIDPDTPSDLAISKSLTPYSEGFLPYLDVLHESWKLFDNKPAGPRYPSFSIASSFGKAVGQMQGWFTTREINGQGFKQAALEAAELASGFNNYSQGLLLLGMRDKVTANGNTVGDQYSLAEAYGKMFLGAQSQKEIDAYDSLNILGEHRAEKKQMAKDIHQSMMNIRNKIGEDDFEQYANRLNSFISLLPEKQFTEQDKLELMDEIVKLDRNSYTTLKQSIFADVWKHHSNENNAAMTRVMDILRRSKNADTQNFVKLLDEGKL
jgi:hypothetical protein